MQFDILEEIGKFKDNGLTQNIICKEFKLESKYIFHHLRILETHGLMYAYN